MSGIFGVTSALAADTRLTNGYQMYSWVMRMNSFPAFWGRGITGNNAVTAEEAEFLHEQNCKIALLVDDLTEAGVSANSDGNVAMQAVEAAKALGVPQGEGIALFAEFGTDWSIHHNWMISFAQTVFENGYIPGFIGNTDSSKNFNFDRQCSHYVQATPDTEGYGAIYWATEPKQSSEFFEWAPFCPSALSQEKISLWSTGEIRLNEAAAEEVYARDISVLEHMW